MSAHLVADLPGQGQLIVRYAPSALLSQSVPWWLGRKYEVRMVDGWGQNIASTGEAAAAPTSGNSYRVSLDPACPTPTWSCARATAWCPGGARCCPR